MKKSESEILFSCMYKTKSESTMLIITMSLDM
jgi:hypothetical protein